MVYKGKTPAKFMEYIQENTSKEEEHQEKIGRIQYSLKAK
jgi:hypothetical protein